MSALLDTNCLIALLDRQHVRHELVRHWFAENAAAGWATCPITENGFVRIVSQPRYPGSDQFTISELVDLLGRATAHPAHVFWGDAVTIRDAARIDAGKLRGPQEVTDCYLLALAVEHGGQLVTLDQSVAKEAVVRATNNDLVELAEG